jgi:hypothetical protein
MEFPSILRCSWLAGFGWLILGAVFSRNVAGADEPILPLEPKPQSLASMGNFIYQPSTAPSPVPVVHHSEFDLVTNQPNEPVWPLRSQSNSIGTSAYTLASNTLVCPNDCDGVPLSTPDSESPPQFVLQPPPCCRGDWCIVGKSREGKSVAVTQVEELIVEVAFIGALRNDRYRYEIRDGSGNRASQKFGSGVNLGGRLTLISYDGCENETKTGSEYRFLGLAGSQSDSLQFGPFPFDTTYAQSHQKLSATLFSTDINGLSNLSGTKPGSKTDFLGGFRHIAMSDEKLHRAESRMLNGTLLTTNELFTKANNQMLGLQFGWRKRRSTKNVFLGSRFAVGVLYHYTRQQGPTYATSPWITNGSFDLEEHSVAFSMDSDLEIGLRLTKHCYASFDVTTLWLFRTISASDSFGKPSERELTLYGGLGGTLAYEF